MYIVYNIFSEKSTLIYIYTYVLMITYLYSQPEVDSTWNCPKHFPFQYFSGLIS
jgi:hypothetical protein